MSVALEMLNQILVPAVIFTAMVLLLSGFVLLARHYLEPTGSVIVNVDGERSLEVNVGEMLLWSLARNGIYLPAACGGRGTCGQCRITVLSGGGTPLSAEAAHIGPLDASAGIRLACKVKIREAMRIALPKSTLSANHWDCVVESNRCVSTYMKELVLKLPANERMTFRAGEYVLLEAPAGHIRFRDMDIDDQYFGEWEANGLFDLETVIDARTVRAYSLANPPQQNDRIVLVVRIATPPSNAPTAPPGCASSYIFSLVPNDTVAISGPFGDFHVNESDREMVCIAGGAGIAPIRSIVLDELAKGSRRKMSLWYGSRTIADRCYQDEFTKLAQRYDNFEFNIAISTIEHSQEWQGYRGFIHSVVYEQYLRNHPTPEQLEYYLCGPPLMSAAVVEMLVALGVDKNNIYFDDFGS